MTTGDDESVDDFIAELQQCDERMRRMASRVLDDLTLVDDVLQTAYVKAYNNRASFRGASKFETWLYTIVYRTCLDQARSSVRHVSLAADQHHAIPAESDPHVDERLFLEAALRQLSANQRAAVWLVDVEGHTFAEAATILGEPEGTVASRVSRARARLRDLLAVDFEQGRR